MRRKIKQKIGFLHPERGVNEPVRQRGRRLPLNTPGREMACRGHSRTRKVPESSASVSPTSGRSRKHTSTGANALGWSGIRHFRRQLMLRDAGKGISNAKMFCETLDTAFPASQPMKRSRKGCFLHPTISGDAGKAVSGTRMKRIGAVFGCIRVVRLGEGVQPTDAQRWRFGFRMASSYG